MLDEFYLVRHCPSPCLFVSPWPWPPHPGPQFQTTDFMQHCLSLAFHWSLHAGATSRSTGRHASRPSPGMARATKEMTYRWSRQGLSSLQCRCFLTRYGSLVWAAAAAAGGRHFAVGGASQQVHVLESSSGQELAALAGHTDDITHVVFEPPAGGEVRHQRDEQPCIHCLPVVSLVAFEPPAGGQARYVAFLFVLRQCLTSWAGCRSPSNSALPSGPVPGS